MKTKIALITAVLLTGLANTARAEGTFNAQEFSVSAFLGDTGKDDADFAPGFGISYFPTRHFGFGAYTHIEEYDGKFIDNLYGEVQYRYPIRYGLAPYALASAGYSFEGEETIFGLGGGVEWRFNDRWGIFGDVRYQWNDDTDDGAGYRLGIRYTF